MRAVLFSPSWPKINLWLVFCAPIWAKFNQFGKILSNFGISPAKIGGENRIARIRPFLTNFGQNAILRRIILRQKILRWKILRSKKNSLEEDSSPEYSSPG
jgi:hypothetical protein